MYSAKSFNLPLIQLPLFLSCCYPEKDWKISYSEYLFPDLSPLQFFISYSLARNNIPRSQGELMQVAQNRDLVAPVSKVCYISGPSPICPGCSSEYVSLLLLYFLPIIQPRVSTYFHFYDSMEVWSKWPTFLSKAAKRPSWKINSLTFKLQSSTASAAFALATHFDMSFPYIRFNRCGGATTSLIYLIR
jgi:hypothetical protein